MILNFNNISTLESSMSFSTQSWNSGIVNDVLLSVDCLDDDFPKTGYPCNNFGNLDATHNNGRYVYY